MVDNSDCVFMDETEIICINIKLNIWYDPRREIVRLLLKIRAKAMIFLVVISPYGLVHVIA